MIARYDHGESDRILRLLTPSRGKVGVIAPRARSPKSPYSGLDLGVGLRARWRERGELGRLTEAEVVDPRARLRESYERLAVASYCLELVGAFSREGQPEPKLYGLAEMALVLLDGLDGGFESAFVAALEGKVLSFAGLCPRLGSCARCGGALEEATLFSLQSGASHRRCAPDEEGLLVVDPETLRRLEDLRRAPLREAIAGEAVEDLLYRVVVFQLGRPLRSRALLDVR